MDIKIPLVVQDLLFKRFCFLDNFIRGACLFMILVKGKLGELEFYFRKIPLHQQKFLVVSIFSNSPWLPRNLKNGPK